MIAHLGMYDRPETADANDRFWSLIQLHLGYGPRALTRSDDFWAIWRSPDLLMSQTCGMPYRTSLRDQVSLIGTPDYGLSGCPAGYYQSVFVARDKYKYTTLKDCDGAVFGFNEALSQSGWAAPLTHMKEQGVKPGALLNTGSHIKSARAVADGLADFASLDALSWILMQRYDAFAEDLCVLTRTTPTPTLPFITARTQEVNPIFDAMASAIEGLDSRDRELLHLRGLVRVPASAYLAVPTPEPPWT